jgi:hypothetical protein
VIDITRAGGLIVEELKKQGALKKDLADEVLWQLARDYDMRYLDILFGSEVSVMESGMIGQEFTRRGLWDEYFRFIDRDEYNVASDRFLDERIGTKRLDELRIESFRKLRKSIGLPDLASLPVPTTERPMLI